MNKGSATLENLVPLPMEKLTNVKRNIFQRTIKHKTARISISMDIVPMASDVSLFIIRRGNLLLRIMFS